MDFILSRRYQGKNDGTCGHPARNRDPQDQNDDRTQHTLFTVEIEDYNSLNFYLIIRLKSIRNMLLPPEKIKNINDFKIKALTMKCGRNNMYKLMPLRGDDL